MGETRIIRTTSLHPRYEPGTRFPSHWTQDFLQRRPNQPLIPKRSEMRRNSFNGLQNSRVSAGPSRGQLFSTPDAGTRGYITDDRLWRGMEEYDRHRRREARRRQREEEHRMYRDLDMTSFTRYYAEKCNIPEQNVAEHWNNQIKPRILEEMTGLHQQLLELQTRQEKRENMIKEQTKKQRQLSQQIYSIDQKLKTSPRSENNEEKMAEMLNKLHELACTDRRLACLTQDRIQSDINFIKLRMFRLEQAERRGEGWLYVKEDPAQAQARHEFFKDQQLFLSQLSPLVIAPPGANTVYGDPKTFVEGFGDLLNYPDNRGRILDIIESMFSKDEHEIDINEQEELERLERAHRFQNEMLKCAFALLSFSVVCSCYLRYEAGDDIKSLLSKVLVDIFRR
ncbi:uncharacterized protein LOC142341233 [Convolutriloba macropyga]|uniref:uncharacterized protein LOC142341233 n=1 Tax=Convolutriloba macropyga TaxID=536237 RepID=UPI003F526BF6